jgi:hypothetical protein
MSPCLFLAAALLPGQIGAAGIEPAARLAQPVVEMPSPPSSTTPSPSNERDTPQPDQEADGAAGADSERWWLMSLLQGTTLGKALDAQRVEISGWTALGFLTSTSPAEPGGNWGPRLNQVLLRQEWIRIDRPIDVKSSEPTFGFHLDVLAGSDYSFVLQRDFLNNQLLNSRGTKICTASICRSSS